MLLRWINVPAKLPEEAGAASLGRALVSDSIEKRTTLDPRLGHSTSTVSGVPICVNWVRIAVRARPRASSFASAHHLHARAVDQRVQPLSGGPYGMRTVNVLWRLQPVL